MPFRLQLHRSAILWIGGATLAAWLAFVIVLLAEAAPPPQAVDQGKQIFQQTCSSCHTIGKGRLIGPDLQGITQQRDAAWLKQFISDPAKMIASDPAAKQLASQYTLVMPTLGLTPEQIDAVIAYLANPAAAAGPAPTAIPAGAGNPAVGRMLFEGSLRMQNGGTPCMSCHTVNGVSAIGGGTLGPDLTNVVTRLGEPGVSAALANIQFPTMVNVFINKPLTPAEQADIVAFLVQANQMTAAPASQNTLVFLGIGAAGMLILFGVLLAFWRNQRQTAIEELRRSA